VAAVIKAQTERPFAPPPAAPKADPTPVAPSVVKPEARDLTLEPLPEHVEFYRFSEEELTEKIEAAGHDVPEGAGKHFLVALCKNALKNPQPVRAKVKAAAKAAEGSDEEGASTLANVRRPTVGDKVQIMDNNHMRKYLDVHVGKVFRIIRDDGGGTPYRLSGVGEQRHWFSEADVCWPVAKPKKAKGAPVAPVAKSDIMPSQVRITKARYGCSANEVREVLRATEDGFSWVLTGGRQVPKSHEGNGWRRLLDSSKPAAPGPGVAAAGAAGYAPPPPPPPPPQHAPTCPAAPQVFEEDAPAPAVWDDRDPCELAPGELRARLQLYGGELLLGLTEKSELVDALREAIRTRGPPSLDAVTKASKAGGGLASLPTGEGVALTEEEVIAQMEEMQATLDAEVHIAAGEAGASPQASTAAQAASVPPKVVVEAANPAQAARRKRKAEAAAPTPPAPKVLATGAGGAARAARKARLEAANCPPKEAERSDVVVMSDDEEGVCAVETPAAAGAAAAAGPMSIDDDDACVVAPAAEEQQADQKPEVVNEL
ncbi:unnamed protein product, partial [Polarella glacialis]